MPKPASLLVLLLVLAPSLASAQGTDETRREWNRPVLPFRIVGDIYYVGLAGVSAFLIKTTAGAILVDGALPESAPLIAANLATLGVKLADVKILVNTHAHFDHAGGLAELKRQTRAQLVASAADADDLAAGRSVDLGDRPDVAFPAVAVDRRIHDGDTVVLGKTTLTAVATPGHTRGCTSWTMTTEEAGKRLAVFFHCSSSAPDYRLVDNRTYPAIAEDYRKTFEKLTKARAEVFLAPHPFFFELEAKRARLAQGAPNPFIDPTELGRFNAASQRSFEAALATQRKAQESQINPGPAK